MNYTLSHIERLISAILALGTNLILGTNLKTLGTNLSSLGRIRCNSVDRAFPRHPIGTPVVSDPPTLLMPATTVHRHLSTLLQPAACQVC